MAKFGAIETFDLESKRSWVDNPDWYIQEKVDGSQFSFTLDDELKFYNKKKEISKNVIFATTIDSITLLSSTVNLNPDYVYHGEAIRKQRHNVISYFRAPRHHFILFEIYSKSHGYLKLDECQREAERLGLEMVQTLYQNKDPQITPVSKCLEIIDLIEQNKIESCLGGKIEGIVFKHLHAKKQSKIVATKLKLVTRQFKESVPGKLHGPSFIESIVSKYKTEARWRKSLQHVREYLPAESKNDDIRREFMIELKADFVKEHETEVKNLLWEHFIGEIISRISQGSENWLMDVLESE